MFKHRLISSIILIAIVSVCVYLDLHWPFKGVDGFWLMPLLLFFTWGTAWEMATLIERGKIPIQRGVATLGALVIVIGSSISILWPVTGNEYPADCPIGRLGWIGIMSLVALGFNLWTEMRTYQRPPWTTSPGVVVTRSATTGLVSLYVGAPLAFMALTRDVHSGSRGLIAIIGVILVTKCGDIGAYSVGKLCGKHKLIPRISPGKTWEGLAGGVGLAVLASVLWFGGFWSWSPSPKHWGTPILFGVLAAILGLFGDLAESMVKRDTGQKDSGGLLPGLGGVWDVTDSLIATSLLGYLLIAGKWIG